MARRVVITGIGAVSPLGTGADKMWEAIKQGRSGVGPLTRFDGADGKIKVAAEVRDFDPDQYIDRKEKKRMDKFTHYAVAASAQALQDAGLNSGSVDPERIGVAISTGIGGMETFEEQHKRFLEQGSSKVSPFFIPMMIANMAAGNVAIAFNAKGPSTLAVTACAAGAHTICEAMTIIRDGRADVMITGASEASITPLAVAGFAAMQALSTVSDPDDTPKPFDKRRDGFVMGEGAGVLMLEELEHAEKRGARIYAELVGFGTSTDAHHITAPAPGGEGPARAMAAALAYAGIGPEDVGYINAHGTGTPYNDKCETEAIKRVFGPHAYEVSVSSTKSMTGHLLGAAGAIEAIILAKSLQEGFLPPTIHYGEPDPDCDLDYVTNAGRHKSYEYAMSNSLGFGGHNATIVMRRYSK